MENREGDRTQKMKVCGGITGRNGDDDEHKGNEPKVTEILSKQHLSFSVRISIL